MRSLGFTLLLALTAALVCGVAGWQWMGGNFDSILGVPPTPVGQRLYTAFTPDKVKHIKVSQNGVIATFSLTEKGWQTTSPWKDRMDPRKHNGGVFLGLNGVVVKSHGGTDALGFATAIDVVGHEMTHGSDVPPLNS